MRGMLLYVPPTFWVAWYHDGIALGYTVRKRERDRQGAHHTTAPAVCSLLLYTPGSQAAKAPCLVVFCFRADSDRPLANVESLPSQSPCWLLVVLTTHNLFFLIVKSFFFFIQSVLGQQRGYILSHSLRSTSRERHTHVRISISSSSSSCLNYYITFFSLLKHSLIYD
jgi:hypothetical protein